MSNTQKFHIREAIYGGSSVPYFFSNQQEKIQGEESTPKPKTKKSFQEFHKKLVGEGTALGIGSSDGVSQDAAVIKTNAKLEESFQELFERVILGQESADNYRQNTPGQGISPNKALSPRLDSLLKGQTKITGIVPSTVSTPSATSPGSIPATAPTAPGLNPPVYNQGVGFGLSASGSRYHGSPTVSPTHRPSVKIKKVAAVSEPDEKQEKPDATMKEDEDYDSHLQGQSGSASGMSAPGSVKSFSELVKHLHNRMDEEKDASVDDQGSPKDEDDDDGTPEYSSAGGQQLGEETNEEKYKYHWEQSEKHRKIADSLPTEHKYGHRQASNHHRRAAAAYRYGEPEAELHAKNAEYYARTSHLGSKETYGSSHEDTKKTEFKDRDFGKWNSKKSTETPTSSGPKAGPKTQSKLDSLHRLANHPSTGEGEKSAAKSAIERLKKSDKFHEELTTNK